MSPSISRTYSQHLIREVGPTDFLGPNAIRVNEEINIDLSKAYTKGEAYETLQQMNATKALGLDGMATIFFQKFWHVIGKTSVTTILRALNTGQFPNALNHTNIILIPKNKSPEKVVDYIPISLYNVIYNLKKYC